MVIQVKKNARQNTVAENSQATDFGSRFCAWFELRHLILSRRQVKRAGGSVCRPIRCTHVTAVDGLHLSGSGDQLHVGEAVEFHARLHLDEMCARE